MIVLWIYLYCDYIYMIIVIILWLYYDYHYIVIIFIWWLYLYCDYNYYSVLTDHGLQCGLGYFDKLLIDHDGQITQNLPVLRQVEVLQTVLVLFRRVLSHEGLWGDQRRFSDQTWEGNNRFSYKRWKCATAVSPPLHCTASDSAGVDWC